MVKLGALAFTVYTIWTTEACFKREDCPQVTVYTVCPNPQPMATTRLHTLTNVAPLKPHGSKATKTKPPPHELHNSTADESTNQEEVNQTTNQEEVNQTINQEVNQIFSPDPQLLPHFKVLAAIRLQARRRYEERTGEPWQTQDTFVIDRRLLAHIIQAVTRQQLGRANPEIIPYLGPNPQRTSWPVIDAEVFYLANTITHGLVYRSENSADTTHAYTCVRSIRDIIQQLGQEPHRNYYDKDYDKDYDKTQKGDQTPH